MRLTDLLNDKQGYLSSDDPEVTGISEDSRKIKPGYIFVTYKGSQLDGTRFIPDAVANGAAAVLAAEPLEAAIPVILHSNPRRALAELAATFHPGQPETVVAVTGTNGKTSVVHFCRELWQKFGLASASLGTLGVIGEGGAPLVSTLQSMTTPDPVFLHQTLATLKDQEITNLAIEASSHGLDQYRLDAIHFKAAGFTSFSRDHLDYHPSMKHYFNAKLRLFTELLQDGVAVINADMQEAEALINLCPKALTYGVKGKTIQLKERRSTLQGQEVTIHAYGKDYHLTLPFVGEFQVGNLMCAAGLVKTCGREMADILLMLPGLAPVPGRMERVASHPSGGGVYIDYAHTPDALEKALLALKPHAAGKLIAVFGCGGNRDPGKRPIMGRIASDHAKVVIVTDDNPRYEDPSQIRQAVLAAVPGAIEIGDRTEAIKRALTLMQNGDVVLIAGKGHESTQIIGDVAHPFSDREEARRIADQLW